MKQLKTQKQSLRISMLEKRRLISPNEKAAAEKRVCAKLRKLILEQNVKVLHTFLPMGLELNHTPVIEYCLANEISVVTTKTLPKSTLQHLVLTDLNDLENGVFGTKHPRNAQEYNGTFDLIIVPGLAFDAEGNRLGYGGGYYDAFLKHHPESLKIAIALPFQLVAEVPVEPFDQKVDRVLT